MYMELKASVKNLRLAAVMAAVLCAALPSLCGAQDWKATASATYETGKYGTDTRTTTYYLPLTVKRYLGVGDVSIVVPYIVQESTGQISTIEGRPIKLRKAKSVGTTTNSGIGDVLLKGTYYLITEGKDVPFNLSLDGKIKVPTADDTKGLGTGEFDEGVGLEFDMGLRHGYRLFADASYTFIGKPSGTDLRDKAAFDAGVSKEINQKVTLSVFYEESTPPVSGDEDARDVAVNAEFKVDKDVRFFVGGAIGLTNTAPERSVTAGASVRF